MKKLFALMALAGLAAFQVGCGEPDSKKPTTATPPAMGAGGVGAMPGMPGMPGAGGDKKAGEEPKKDEPAATEGDKADATPADGEKKEGEEPKKDE